MANPSRPPPDVMGRGFLFLPQQLAGLDSLPGIVVLPGLGGLIEERELRYGHFLAEQGYVVLVCDSFEARDAAYESHPRRALVVTETMLLADAFAALKYLARLPMVDPNRIGVMGGSYGGMVSVFCAYEQIRRLYAPDGLRFAAHACFYGCSIARFTDATTTGAPLRIYLGERDRNVCPERTGEIADDLRRGGSDVVYRLFPEAYHQWDSKHTELSFIRFSLRTCRFQVEPNNRIWDLRTRLTLRGRLSRTLAIAANADPRGYHMLRDEKVLAETDRDLLTFFGSALQGATSPIAGRVHLERAGGDAQRGLGLQQTTR